MTPLDKAIYWASYVFREICDIVLPYGLMNRWPRPRERVLRVTVEQLRKQLGGELIGECTDNEFEVHGHFKERAVRLRFTRGFDLCIVELNGRRKPGGMLWKLAHDKKSRQKRRDQWTREATVAMLETVGGHVEYDDGTVQIWPSDAYIYDFGAARRVGDDLELAWHIGDAFDQMIAETAPLDEA